jgi:K+ transporter
MRDRMDGAVILVVAHGLILISGLLLDGWAGVGEVFATFAIVWALILAPVGLIILLDERRCR